MAEEVGFEPTRAFTLLVFKTSAFNHSAIPPKRIEGYHIRPPFEALRKERLPLHDKPGEKSAPHTREEDPCRTEGPLRTGLKPV